MKNKIKKFFQNKILLLILGIFIGGTASIYAVTYFPSNQVTYNNTSSKLNSTDVQGAIDELYNTCSKAVSTGDYIYYLSKRNSNYDIIYQAPISGGSSKAVLKEDHDSIVQFNISGDYIYYLSRWNSNYDIIYQVSISSGSSKTILKEDNGEIEQFRISGDYIYYLSRWNSNYDYIYRVPISGGTPTTVLSLNHSTINSWVIN